MIIESIHVQNFRSIKGATLDCENLTVLVGANGSGKSAFLRALELFYSESPKIDIEDYYNKDTSKEIVIAITFKNLSDEAKELFNKYLQNNKLTVQRVFKWDGGKIIAIYHGDTLQNSDFKEIREADKAKEATEKYKTIREKEEYNDLPVVRSRDDIFEALAAWEELHPEQCKRERDNGQFFGFKGVASGYLNKYTKLLFIHAVRDASQDASDIQKSVITEILDLVVRSVISTRQDILDLKTKTKEEYKEIMKPENLRELSGLQTKMTDTLKTFAPNSGVKLNWKPIEDPDIPLPRADVKLIEDEYESDVVRVGHGLQRVFIITMLQHLAVAREKMEIIPDDGKEDNQSEAEILMPDLVLIIEEPELYQHPSRQRHLAKVLLQLAEGEIPGVAEKTQVIYSTHSPLFVGIDRINQIRLLKKENYEAGKPKITKIVSTNLDKIAKIIWKTKGEPGSQYTGEMLLPRLKTIMTPWTNEGFFADVIVLVEGEDDRAAILGVANSMNLDLESEGFAVIPCSGKASLDRPFIIFSQFGIPVYIVWDGDKGGKDAKPEDNHYLLKLVNEKNMIDWPSGVYEKYACFEKDLDTTLRDEIGKEKFNQFLVECQEKYSVPEKKHALKNSFIIEEIVKKAQKEKLKSKSLENIIDKIKVLRQ